MKRAAAGFTLIELTVVMLLLGVVLALAAPGLGRLYARLSLESSLAELHQQIGSLSLVAYALGEEGTLTELLERHAQLPEGWSLRGGDAVYIRSSGLCSGGTVELLTPSGSRTLELEPPFCASAGPG